MTIRYQCDSSRGKCYVKEHMPDWSVLNGCFPPDVRPTDVDGAVELRGHVLFIEWKGIDAPLKRGQQRMFENMTRDAPKQRVLVLFGERNQPKRAVLFIGGKRRNRQCDIAWVKRYCAHWTEMATGERPPYESNIAESEAPR